MITHKIILQGTLENQSALSIGSGADKNSDADVLVDSKGKPFIPATSAMGGLRRVLIKNTDSKTHNLINAFWGIERPIIAYKEDGKDKSKEEDLYKSLIICSDFSLVDNCSTDVRDSIRINNATGIVKPEGKFDREVVAPGAKFVFTLEIEAREGTFYTSENAKSLMGSIIEVMEKGFNLGARRSSGLGKVLMIRKYVKIFDFKNRAHQIEWLNYLQKRTIEGDVFLQTLDKGVNHDFIVKASFSLSGSMLIRSYPNNATDSDSSHLKSGDKDVLSGSSVRGALRARAEKIIRTLGGDPDDLLNELFGWVEPNKNGTRETKNIASRFFVNEVAINHVCEQEQSRVQIDRFTGGARKSALFDSKPIYNQNKNENIKDFEMVITNAAEPEIGLTLLLLKDLYTADIAIGGEKSIGRGTLVGKNASIYLPGSDKPIELKENNIDVSEIITLQNYVDKLKDELKKQKPKTNEK